MNDWMKTSSSSSGGGGGIGFLGVLQLIFITLKLCRVIDWSWLVVLIPLWISLGFTILVLWYINKR